MSAVNDTVWQEGAPFITDVFPAGHDPRPEIVLEAAGEPCDVIVVAVPVGEGVTLETVIHRAFASGRKHSPA